MPLDIGTAIDIYVRHFENPADPEFQYDIEFFSDPNMVDVLLDGRIVVPRGGAAIRFHQVKKAGDKDWSFHDLTIHPTGPETGKVDLKWVIAPSTIIVHDPGKGRRTFSYAIAVKRKDGLLVYFDPQLENLGGG